MVSCGTPTNGVGGPDPGSAPRRVTAPPFRIVAQGPSLVPGSAPRPAELGRSRSPWSGSRVAAQDGDRPAGLLLACDRPMRFVPWTDGSYHRPDHGQAWRRCQESSLEAGRPGMSAPADGWSVRRSDAAVVSLRRGKQYRVGGGTKPAANAHQP
jgi:hypothetical protein